MRIFSCVLCVMALAALVVGAQAPGPTGQDKSAVRQAAYDYAESKRRAMEPVRGS